MRDTRLDGLAMAMLAEAPLIQGIRSSGHWGTVDADLRQLVSTGPVPSLRPDIDGFIADGFRSSEGLNRLLTVHAQRVSVPDLIRLSISALEAPRSARTAAFLLSIVSLLLLSEDFQKRVKGPRPHLEPWYRVPYATAALALDMRSLWASGLLVRLIYDVLESSRPNDRIGIDGVVAEFRQLGSMIERRREMAILNLAEDLRDSCRAGPTTFRAEVGAIAWTLGLVPESRVFQAAVGSDFIPSRRFFRQLVRQSILTVPTDVMLQHVWLALKDRGPFNLREHDSLFHVINNRYENNRYENWAGLAEMAFGVSPPAIYARSLIAYMRGSVDRSLASECAKVWLGTMVKPPRQDFARGATVALMLVDRMDPGSASLPHWLRLVDTIANWPRDDNPLPLHGTLPASIPQFFVHEYRAGVSTVSLLDAISDLEHWRRATLSYWLAVGYPLPTAAERELLGNLLDHEHQLIELLRGTYFEALLPSLPEHYWYHGMADPSGGPDPSTAAKRYRKLEAELQSLRQEMERRAPSYGERRPGPTGVGELQQLIAAHASPRVSSVPGTLRRVLRRWGRRH